MVTLKLTFFFREAKTDMRKEYCKEEETDNRQPVESCDIDEIAIAKSWTYVYHKNAYENRVHKSHLRYKFELSCNYFSSLQRNY